MSSFKYMNPKELSVSETCPAQQIRKTENRELKPDPSIFDFNILVQDDWPSKTVASGQVGSELYNILFIES